MKTIVIVHGAWMDISAWDAVLPILKASGAEVIGVNLPGHGKDTTPVADITFQSYADAVKNAIGTRTDITLVGHSMGGLVISQVVEQIPTQIGKLIYVCAFLPKNGDSLLSLANTDDESYVPKFLKIDEQAGLAYVAKEGTGEVFAHDVPKEALDKLIAYNNPDPLVPLATPVMITDANFGSAKKVYIFSEDDRTIGYKLQQRMKENAPNVLRSYTVPTSHSPFLAMPEVIAAIILNEAK